MNREERYATIRFLLDRPQLTRAQLALLMTDVQRGAVSIEELRSIAAGSFEMTRNVACVVHFLAKIGTEGA
jgi:hypothetical protein